MPNDTDSLAAANAQARAILEAGMGDGYHSLPQRLKSFLTVSGGETPLTCVIHGHQWYLNSQKNDRYMCFCDRCGDGSYFDTIPDEADQFLYDCRQCDAVLDVDELIPHWQQFHHTDPAEYPPEYRFLIDDEIRPFFDRYPRSRDGQ